MKSVLVDTHALLWFLFQDQRISDRAVEVIEGAEWTTLLSVVGLWEIAIKHQLGKLVLGMSYEVFLQRFVRDASIEVVGIELEHLRQYESLPLRHRDPFDRMLIAQAKTLGVPLLTADPAFAAYGTQTIW